MRTWCVFRRSLSTLKNSIGQIFIKEDVQKLLTEITRFEESKIFASRPVPKLTSPKLMFMTDEQLTRAKDHAYSRHRARTQMPPVMDPNTSEPKVLSRDEEIAGYTKFKIVFVDISPGYSDRARLMSVREPDGTLRYPTYDERSRMNNIFYPKDERSIDAPKLFQEEYLQRLLKRKEYVYVLNRACVQFEPDDPRFIEVATKVYSYIDDKGDFDLLRSTRFFGPMSLYLAFNKRADNLISEMLSKKLVEDAVKLVKIYHTCHNIDYNDSDNSMQILKDYSDKHSTRKHTIDLALQSIEDTS